MSKRIIALVVAIMFIGATLVAPMAASADGESSCDGCKAAYDAFASNEESLDPTCVAMFFTSSLSCCALFGGCDDSDELIGIPICFFVSIVVFLQCESSYSPEPAA